MSDAWSGRSEINPLTQSLYTGFIDGNVVSDDEYQPRLLINDASIGEKVLTCISRELLHCDEFKLSVAFVTRSGVVTLLNILKEIEAKGVHGVIVSSQYQNFTEPNALRDLLKFKNIELRIATEGNLHTKGYIFRRKSIYSMIVGSSNLTQNALCENKEWNLKVSTTSSGSLMVGTLAEFEQIRNCSTLVDENWITAYEFIYNSVSHPTTAPEMIADSKSIAEKAIISLAPLVNPNGMQKDALMALHQIRDRGKERAIIISATGTGKTYLSAFDVKSQKAERFLFVVHRENIARAALDSFRKVFGSTVTYGVLAGYARNQDAQYLFATIQTLSKEDVHQQFSKDHFDYIVIDEVHRSGAYSYQKIINYFQPRFMLGMTATPERTDGYNIYELFHNNVAYEIRLQQAMRENMICPFHYFGVTELTIDGKLIDDLSDFRKLTSELRVDNVIEKINFYGYSGNRVRGLIFCSRKDEAKVLSAMFNEKGYRTIALVGENSEEDREEAIRRIEQLDAESGLDYIFTVDIFNEGVDIPSINQVVMLRPTESAIIFVQQLGRGLRKTMAKEYVVVIDFIGNYRKNFMIPIALSGDQTYNKDTIRKFVAEGNKTIPGCSTVHFDPITRQRIYAAIDAANFSDAKLIRDSYDKLKFRLGRIPSMKDFDQYGSIDLLILIDKYGSYNNFLAKYEKEYKQEFLDMENEFIDFASRKFASGKRIHELVFLEILFGESQDILNDFSTRMEELYGIRIQTKSIKSLVNILSNHFLTGSSKDAYKNSIFIKPSAEGVFRSEIFISLAKNPLWRIQMNEIMEFGKTRWKEQYTHRYENTDLCLYQKYTYEDVCRLLEWERAEVALNIGGYKFDKSTKTYPVFINYHKDDKVVNTMRYEDRFLTPSSLIAISKSGRTAESDDVMQAYRAEEDDVAMHLFVRRNKDDSISKEFYYLGKIKAVGKPNPILMKNTNKGAVEINYKLHTPVREDIYDFITHWNDE